MMSIEKDIGKNFQFVKGKVELVENAIVNRTLPGVHIKTNIKSIEALKSNKKRGRYDRIRKKTISTLDKFSGSIDYILLQDITGEDIAGVDNEGSWFS